MSVRQRLKPKHAIDFRDRGVTVAQQTFNLPGGGSNPSGPTMCLKMVRNSGPYS